MKITNNNGIPNIIYLATKAGWYSGENVKKDYSVTELLSPPLLRRLEMDYKEYITIEASDLLWSMMGSALHHILERGSFQEKRYLVEKRFTESIFGKMISGQIDVYDKVLSSIEDHKYTSVWEYIHRNDKHNSKIADWEFQLNVYRLLAITNGLPVTKLSINLLFRDFSANEAKIARLCNNKDKYPWTSSIQIPIRIMDEEEIFGQIQHHILKHEQMKYVPISEIPVCSSIERWQDPNKWAVMKKGREKAVRVLYSLNDAQKYIEEKVVKDKKLHYIDKRIGIPKRCLNYCPVSSFCPWFKKYNETERLK
jgi:hypothetical protein